MCLQCGCARDLAARAVLVLKPRLWRLDLDLDDALLSHFRLALRHLQCCRDDCHWQSTPSARQTQQVLHESENRPQGEQLQTQMQYSQLRAAAAGESSQRQKQTQTQMQTKQRQQEQVRCTLARTYVIRRP